MMKPAKDIRVGDRVRVPFVDDGEWEESDELTVEALEPGLDAPIRASCKTSGGEAWAVFWWPSDDVEVA